MLPSRSRRFKECKKETNKQQQKKQEETPPFPSLSNLLSIFFQDERVMKFLQNERGLVMLRVKFDYVKYIN
jgi:hypothetical protein